MTMTKAERTELRSIVRQQFNVLRSEVAQREAELVADVDTDIAAQFQTADEAWDLFLFKANEAVREANRTINDAYVEAGGKERDGYDRVFIPEFDMRKPTADRNQLRQVAIRKIEAQRKGALLSLERQEADLLRDLGVGALESDEARKWLASIPTVGELVPAVRLAELIAGPSGEGTDTP